MSGKIYISGTLYDKEDAKISVFDHGLLYGDGVFEGLRAYQGKVFRIKKHVERLWQSAKSIYLEIPGTQDEMVEAINATLLANDLKDSYIRVVVTRGAGALGLDPNKTSNPQVIIIADTITMYPEEFYENGLEIVTSTIIRNHPQALNPKIKSLNYLNNILAKIEGQMAGCVETLMLNHKGQVAECTGDNLFVVRDGMLQTPAVESGILEGITREAVLDLASDANLIVQEVLMNKSDVTSADECFLTGSAAEVIPVVRLDGERIGDGKPGPITRDLKARYHDLVRSE